ncbi:MAG: porphobilinogen synthase [Chitinivibrionales bacterium]|nr:porphobilinogen synthase [Chitinivibrionales bacterium]MBD3355518.1 porphobilinogen synthase [Chitinivibrionales bacterium]
MGFPMQRMRRLRRTDALRRMVRETRLTIDDLILPLFVVHGKGIKREIDTLPGNYHLSIDKLSEEIKEVRSLGIPAVLLFGLPEHKDCRAGESYAADGIVQRAVRTIKEIAPELVVATDVCLCEYTEHGHCGIIRNGYLDNDASLELIAKTALSHAKAGADILAPAAMLDGQIKCMRSVLDKHNYGNTAIMSYAAKFASGLYDPFFRNGTGSVVAFGDKRTHQMDYGNGDEALREVALDIEEGADIVMVKPGMTYLDIVYRTKERFAMPVAVYNVSGEFAMLKAAAGAGVIDEEKALSEAMASFKRAGADLIITYAAKILASKLTR